MKAWIFIHNPLERWMADYRRIFDAWEDGGVRGIVVGRLFFQQEDGTTVPTFASDPSVYESFGVSPPAETSRDEQKERQFQTMLDDAAARGWHIMTFSVGGGGGGRPQEEDPYGVIGHAARVQDTMNALPQVHGFIIDGPGEQHYELAFHHGGELFEIREDEAKRFSILGFDSNRLQRGIDHLRARFHNLTPSAVRYHGPGGLLAGLHLFDINEDALYWLRARRETALGAMSAIREQLHRLNRNVELGGIPRTVTFSSLTCQDYHRMASSFDYIFPKHYFWHRGFDGMYGTIARWVQRLSAWNPALTEADCFAVVTSLFGITLPGVQSLMDLDRGFPDAFFSEVVFSETRRALDAVGDDEKVIAWVSTGRSPHAGDPMSARELHGILTASQQAGLKRFLFHPDPDLGAPEWRVIASLCGNLWKEDPDGYWPSDTLKPASFSGGRRPARAD